MLDDGTVVTIEYRIVAHDSLPSHMEPEDAWVSGVELDSSKRRGQRLTFEVGKQMVLPVLDHAVRSMSKGSEKVVSVVAREAVGVHRCKEVHVPQSQEVACVFRLVCARNTHRKLKEEVDFRYQQAMDAKERGNACFKQKKPREALKSYKQGRKLLEGFAKAKLSMDDNRRCRALLVSLLINSAACALQLGESCADQTIVICSKALSLDRSSVKALFRRAMAYKLLCDEKSCLKDLKCALRLEPSNEDVIREIMKFNEADILAD
mmetsp:Transcript_23342/g.46858  ORF Transcript_23342/g.46858 Transcript_23342/m.46858 type:complete len:264 (+) Transcript_23342:36-827(+)|eukprot:CAMPEP_0196741848 /NCGR_PEP_ID=MMETSP1091-20130531/43155_1 /TAXON_ID=302021 /ORGANISM="Rhodomonas sp., Strain CCMP768" /LENGTH=263 /DNA_ID=CAMNT_0042087697 /DNA_START=35 /DNA_END=826 /DNA_ORIENTATION=+